MTSRIAVLASGGGSNLQAIIDHFDNLARDRVAKSRARRLEPSGSPALSGARRRRSTCALQRADDGSELLALLQKSHRSRRARRLPQADSVEGDRRVRRPDREHPSCPAPRLRRSGHVRCAGARSRVASARHETGATVHSWTRNTTAARSSRSGGCRCDKSDTAESLAARVLNVEHVVYPRVVQMVAILQQLEPKSPV